MSHTLCESHHEQGMGVQEVLIEQYAKYQNEHPNEPPFSVLVDRQVVFQNQSSDFLDQVFKPTPDDHLTQALASRTPSPRRKGHHFVLQGAEPGNVYRNESFSTNTASAYIILYLWDT